MEEKEFLNWMKKKDLLSISRNHFPYFRKVLLNSFEPKNEELLIIGDYGTPYHRIAPILCGAYYFAAKKLGLKARLVMEDRKAVKEEADGNIVKVLSSINNGTLIASCVSNKIGSLRGLGKSFRRYAIAKRLRFVSTPSCGSLPTEYVYHFTRAIDINYTKIEKACSELKEMLDNGRELKIETEKGTSLKVDITEQRAVSNDGNYTRDIRGGNIPAGEVYLPPRKNMVNGTIVIDGSSRNNNTTLLLDKPITMKVKEGDIVKIEGGFAANQLKVSIDWALRNVKYPSTVRKIGEIGIGLNPKADIVGSMIIDEKSYNTSHIAIGSNYWFGGAIYTIIHLDQVFRNPIITIDKKEYKFPKKSNLL